MPAVTGKLILALVLAWQSSKLADRPFQLYIDGGDSESYIQPIEQLLTTGHYIAEPEAPDSAAGRMPGYGATYLAFRLFLGATASKSALALLQVVLSGVSVYYLALSAFLLFRHRNVFLAALMLYGANLFVSVWDNYILTESLAASAVVFFIYNLLQYREQRRRNRLVQASIWYAYLVFLRPFAVPLILVALLIVWSVHQGTDKRLRATFRDLCLVASLFVACEAVWVLRNYAVLGRVIPFQVNTTAGYQYSKGQLALRDWMGAIGQDAAWWQPNTMASWFYGDPRFSNESYQVPGHVVTTTCSLADIKRARELFVAAIADRQAHSRLESEMLPIVTECRDSFRREKPAVYYVVSPLRLAKGLLVHAGPILPTPPLVELVRQPIKLFAKLVAVGLYWLALVSGAIGLLVLARRGLVGWAIAWPFVFVLLFFACVMRLGEARFLVIGFPSLCIGGAQVLATFISAAPRKPPRSGPRRSPM